MTLGKIETKIDLYSVYSVFTLKFNIIKANMDECLVLESGATSRILYFIILIQYIQLVNYVYLVQEVEL